MQFVKFKSLDNVLAFVKLLMQEGSWRVTMYSNAVTRVYECEFEEAGLSCSEDPEILVLPKTKEM